MQFLKRYGLVLFLVLLAFALRAYRLDFFSLRGDESFTVLFVQKPLAQMWSETLTVEPNPPLLYFLLRGWIVLAGAGEFATRFFSLWFGVLCVPFVYRIARDLTPSPSPTRSGGVALIAAFLMAVNPYQIWHSQDVRNYTLWPLLSLAALAFFWKWYASLPTDAASKKWFWWLGGFGIAELAALYTHYYETFILLGLNLFVLATLWRDMKKSLPWLGAQLVLALVYLPYPLILSNRVSAYGEGSGRQGVALWDIVRETFGTFVVGETLEANLRAWLWIPFALVALAGLVFLFRRDWKRGLFFVFYAGVPTVAVFALNTFRPLYLERYLNGIAPAYYLLLAFGIVALSRFLASLFRRKSQLTFDVLRFAFLVLIALVAYFVLANYWTNPAYAKAPDWRGLAALINAHSQHGDIIVQNFPETSLVYYDRSTLPLVVYPQTYLPDGETERALNALNAKYQRAWFIPAADGYWDPYQFVEGWLDRHDDLLSEQTVGDFHLRLYATPAQFLDALHKTNRAFGKSIELLGYRTETGTDTLRVVLYWRALEPIKQSYDVKIQTLDAAGKVLQAQAIAPVAANYPTNKWRVNELVVDQHSLPNVPAAKSMRVSVCSGDNCLGKAVKLEIGAGN